MTIARRDFLIGAGALAATGAVPALARPAATRIIGGLSCGTYWRAVLPAGVDAGDLRMGIGAVLAGVERRMSPYLPDSEISKFNLSRDTGPFALSPPTRAVVGAALRIARLTDGAFDPTLGPAVARFGFGPIAGERGTPGGLVQFDGALRKRDPYLTFDPCGIAKGFALDQVARYLESRGQGDYLVEFGGETTARGRHPGGRPWQVGVAAPGRGRLEMSHVIVLDGQAVASSGDDENGFDLGGRRYCHIIDPATGEPVANGVRAVSVIARRAIHADALATALMVMGPERGMAFAARHDFAALFVLGGGEMREIMTPSFRRHIVI